MFPTKNKIKINFGSVVYENAAIEIASLDGKMVP
jgi:hypothetical protein